MVISKEAQAGFEFGGKTYKVLQLSLLHVDPEYQRKLSKIAVRENITVYNPAAIRALTVSRRLNGTYVVIDGSHRLEIMREMGEECAVCEVHSNLTKKQEAALFVLLNKVRIVSQKDKFRAGVTAGDRTARAVMKIVREHGFNVRIDSGYGRRPNDITCVSALKNIYSVLGEDVLSETLSIISKCFRIEDNGNVQPYACGNLFVAGLANFLFYNKPDIEVVTSVLDGRDAKEIVRTIERESGTSRKDAIPHLVNWLKSAMANGTPTLTGSVPVAK